VLAAALVDSAAQPEAPRRPAVRIKKSDTDPR